MNDPDGDYAPQSPDLSAYHSSSSSYNQPSQSSYYPQQQGYHQQHPPAFQTPNDFSDPFTYGNNQIPHSHRQQQSMMVHHNNGYGMRSELEDPDWMPEGAAPMKAVRKGKGAKMKAADDDCGKAAPGVEEGIKVATKFPVARIKRIMQADEDIGKVAQVTPTAVSKALELFMISVITKAANEAKSKSSKRVTAAHLKQAVEKDDQLDFLQDIISKVPDAPAPKKDEDSEDAHEGKRKKSGGGGARRKKTKEDSDF